VRYDILLLLRYLSGDKGRKTEAHNGMMEAVAKYHITG
jgi:hypothetical protein